MEEKKTEVKSNNRKVVKKKKKRKRLKKKPLIFLIITIAAIFAFLNVYDNCRDDVEESFSDMKNSIAVTDINELDRDTRKKCEEFLKQCRKEGLKVRITETYRSQDRQNMLYEQGRTRPGNVVTWTKKSMHTERRAFDICQDIPGKEYNDDRFFKRCAEIGRRVGLTPGYYWKGHQDKPHFQNDSGISALFN